MRKLTTALLFLSCFAVFGVNAQEEMTNSNEIVSAGDTGEPSADPSILYDCGCGKGKGKGK